MAKVTALKRITNPKEPKKYITVKMSSSLEAMLVEVATNYSRVPSKAHAIRLMIEDSYTKFQLQKGFDKI